MSAYDLHQAEQVDSGWKEVEPLRRERVPPPPAVDRHSPKRKRIPRS
jgi:hypothetical protein